MMEDFFLDNAAMEKTIKAFLKNGENLVFNRSSFEMEGNVVGTDCMKKLVDDSKLMVQLTDDYRSFVCTGLVPALRNIQKAFNEDAENIANSMSNTSPLPQNSGQKNAPASNSASNITAQEIALNLDTLMNRLCDDDDSNDAETIEAINSVLSILITTEIVDGKEYIVYDCEMMDQIMGYLDHQGLAYQMLSNVRNDIKAKEAAGEPIPNKIMKMGLGGNVKYTVLEVEKHGAGVNLLLTCDNDWLPGNEINEKVISYAATEESAYNYFTTDGAYDWEAIKAWYQLDQWGDIHENSIEYDVLAYEMKNMTDNEINSLLSYADYAVDSLGYAYTVSEKVNVLTDRHVLQMEALRLAGYTDDEFENQYTRAVMAKGIAECMSNSGGGKNHCVDISYSTDGFGRRIYKGDVTVLASLHNTTLGDCIAADMAGRTVVVYPFGDSNAIDANLDNEVVATAYGLATGLGEVGGNYVIDQTASFAFGKIAETMGVDVLSLPFSTAKAILDLKKAYESQVDAQGVEQMLDYGNDVQCMYISGSAVHIAGGDADYAYVCTPIYDDKMLAFSVAAYNIEYGTNYTIEEMKEEYVNNSDAFDKYSSWYMQMGGENAALDLYKEVSDEIGGNSKVDSMSVEEIETYLAER